MTPHILEACRAEIERLLEYDKKEPSKACGVVVAKKKGGQLLLRLSQPERGDYKGRLHAYTKPRMDESLSELGDAKFFTLLILCSALWQVSPRKRRERRPDLLAPVEKDAFRLVDCDGDLSKTDGLGFDQHNKEVWESRDVLCG